MKYLSKFYSSCSTKCGITCKSVLLTGGASKKGVPIVRELLRNKVRGIWIVDKNPNGEQYIQDLEKNDEKKRCKFEVGDVRDLQQLEKTFKNASAYFKRLDIVINCASIHDEDNWSVDLVPTNISQLTQSNLLALEYMQVGGGTVLNLASILGLHNFTGSPVFGASQAYIIALTRSMGSNFFLKKYEVRYLCLCAGLLDGAVEGARLGRLKCIDGLDAEFEKELKTLPIQRVKCLAECVVQVLERGANGSVWVSEAGEEVYEIEKTDRKV